MKIALAGACLALVCAACSEGYPSKGDGLNLHFQMTQQEAVQALNTIGSRSHLKHEWRYQVTEACVLEVSAHGRVFTHKTQAAELLGTEVSLFRPDQGELYSVVLTPHLPPTGEQTTVLAGSTWSDASQVKWLLDYLPKFCESPAA